LGVAYLNVGDNQRAIEAFTKLLAIQPNNAGGMAFRGHAFYAEHQYASASHDFLSAAQIDPTPEFLVMAGRSLEDAGDVQHALQIYQQELHANPNDADTKARSEALQKNRRKR